MDAANMAGEEMESPCNRTGVCGKCRVRLSPESMGRVVIPGDSRLPEKLRATGHVLACETFIHGDIGVEPAARASGEALRVLETRCFRGPASWLRPSINGITRTGA